MKEIVIEKDSLEAVGMWFQMMIAGRVDEDWFNRLWAEWTTEQREHFQNLFEQATGQPMPVQEAA